MRSGRPFFDSWQPHAHTHTRSSYGVLSQPWMSTLPFRYLALRLRLRLRLFGLAGALLEDLAFIVQMLQAMNW